MLKIIKQISILALLVLILVFPYFVFGASNIKSGLLELGEASSYETGGITETSVSSIAGTIVSAFLSLLGIIFIVLMLYGGYLWMMARGNEENVTKSQDLIRSAIIGLIIITAAYAISAFVFDRIASQTLNTSPSGGGGGTPTTPTTPTMPTTIQ